MSLTFILNAATIIAGIIGLVDILIWEPRRRVAILKLTKSGSHDEEKAREIAKEPAYVEIAKFSFPLLLIFVLFRSFSDSVDYGLVLIIATAVSGLIWLVDKILWERKRKQAVTNLKKEHEKLPQIAFDAVAREPVIVEYAKAFFPIILIIVILRSFLFEPFKIPSGSMKPTLEIGDFVLVNKFAYGVRLPVTNTKIFDTGSPKRGDVFVFRYPGNPWQQLSDDEKVDYIKRVIGLPGDTILYRNRQLYIKPKCTKEMKICPKATKIDTKMIAKNGYFDRKDQMNLDILEEDLLGVKHKILHDNHVSEYNFELQFEYRCMQGEKEWVVPEKHYFAMGDNREHSADSRFWCFVPEENLVGKAVAIWMNWNSKNKYYIDFSRIGGIK